MYLGCLDIYLLSNWRGGEGEGPVPEIFFSCGCRFTDGPFKMPAELQPDKNDWTVTGKGMVIIRLVWKGMPWTRETETACLGLCESMTEWLQTCC